MVGSANLITKVYFPRLIVSASAMIAGLGGLCAGFPSAGRSDDLLSDQRDGPADLPAGVDAVAGLVHLKCRCLDVGTQREVSRRSFRFAFLDSTLDVCFVCNHPSSSVPPKWRWVLLLNPMSGIIEGYRSALFGLPFDWTAIGVASLLTILLLFYSAYSFSRVDRSFADII